MKPRITPKNAYSTLPVALYPEETWEEKAMK